MTEQTEKKGRAKWLTIGATLGVGVVTALEAVGVIPASLAAALLALFAGV